MMGKHLSAMPFARDSRNSANKDRADETRETTHEITSGLQSYAPNTFVDRLAAYAGK
jgi:hypothetical protein